MAGSAKLFADSNQPKAGETWLALETNWCRDRFSERLSNPLAQIQPQSGTVTRRPSKPEGWFAISTQKLLDQHELVSQTGLPFPQAQMASISLVN